MFKNKKERLMNIKDNFISADSKSAISSYKDLYKVGETVRHQNSQAGVAVIESFEVDTESNEITAHTDKGFSHIDFLVKL